MKAKLFLLSSFCSAVVLSLAGYSHLWSQSSQPPSPPLAPVRPVTDDYFGTRIVDPYRYMENLQDSEVQSWIKGQDDYTRSVLARIPGREKLLARIRELDQSVPQVGAQRLPDNLYVIWKQLPSEDVGKLYLRQGLNGEDKLLADPEKIKLLPENQAKGKSAIAGYEPSGDGKYWAIGIIPGGAETNGEIHVFDSVSGRETGDVISRGVGAEAWEPHWLPDNRSFVYGHLQRLPPGAPVAQARQNFRAYLHVLGTDPEKDPAVFGNGVVPSIDVDPNLIASVQTRPGSRYALGVINGSVTPNSAYYIVPAEEIGKPNTPWRKVADFADGVTHIAMHGDDLYLLTYKNAPRYKIIRTNASHPDLASAETVVAPSEKVITWMSAAQDALYVLETDGAISRVLRVSYGANPKIEQIRLPFDGLADMTTDARVPGGLLYMTSWTKGFKVYSYDPQTRQVSDTKIQPTGPYDDPANIESLEVKVPSYDGTLVPLSIVRPKGLKMNGRNPTLLEGYGGYGISEDPFFVPLFLAWYEKGGVYATCHVRGGGEYGEEWHLAGKGATKPNTWKDFIACGEYLIKQQYTSAARLAGQGGSAGGILVGRAITERPDLFGAAIINVGLLDTLRFENTANGETNAPELGTTKTEDGFKALLAMSAYHHVKDHAAYPAVLLTTGINDPRVDPWEPAKMTARLQAATSSGKPILLRVDYGGGHGGGSGVEQHRERVADSWSFLLWQFGVREFQPLK